MVMVKRKFKYGNQEDGTMTQQIFSIFNTTVLLIAGLMMTGCNKSDRNNPEPPAKAQTYHVTIQAEKNEQNPQNGPRRVLGIDGNTLKATWAIGEQVSVRNLTTGSDLSGCLEAQSEGEQTILSGNLTGTIGTGNALELKFLSPDYTNQEGTLEYISAHCDYAVATIHVTSVSGENLTFEEGFADFENRQAVVKFTLQDQSTDAAINATKLVVAVNGASYTVTPASATSELFVALPGFSSQTITLTANAGSDTYTYTSPSAKTLEDGQYYAITIGMTLAPQEQHVFSVSDTKTVYFSPGNLQYQASSNTWRMAEHQYDLVGEAPAYYSNLDGNVYVGGQKCNNLAIRDNDSYDGWIDLFGWNTANNPLNLSKNHDNYDPENFVDWGVNEIYNPGTGSIDPANTWRTLTHTEWEYLFCYRTNHEKLFGLASIDGLPEGDVKGVIILPDDWTLPDGLSFNAATDEGNVTLTYTTSSDGPDYRFNYPNLWGSLSDETFNNSAYMYNQNRYTVDEWSQLEAAGAAFLPAAGERQDYESFYVVYIGISAAYWA